MTAFADYLCYNPHQPTEVWSVSGNTRRHIYQDELNFRTFLGEGIFTIAAQWFDTIPIATG